MEIIDYTLIKSETEISLRERVRELLDLGWQPIGGAATGLEWGNTIFIQAMVKYERDRGSQG